MKSNPNSYVMSFIGGGLFAVLAEIVYKLLYYVGVSAENHTLFTLAVMAIIGCVMELFGLYSRLDFLSFGSILPFCGLTGAIVRNGYESLKKGDGYRSAYWHSVSAMTSVFIRGIPAAIIVAYISTLIGG